MKRNLIDRTELFNRLATITAADPNEMKAKIYAVIQDMDGNPGAVDIVRCKECKWCLVEEGGCERIGMVLFADEIENHFCGYGEVRDERHR